MKRKKGGAARVQAALDALAVDAHVIELEGSTRTAGDAARVLGCGIAEIAKALVFRRVVSRTPVLVVASGANRVSEKRLTEAVGEAVEMADPKYVQETTGFAIGGVPPFGHVAKLATFLDADLMAHSEVWAAGGTPRAMFRLSTAMLAQITEGIVVHLKETE